MFLWANHHGNFFQVDAFGNHIKCSRPLGGHKLIFKVSAARLYDNPLHGIRPSWGVQTGGETMQLLPLSLPQRGSQPRNDAGHPPPLLMWRHIKSLAINSPLCRAVRTAPCWESTRGMSNGKNYIKMSCHRRLLSLRVWFWWPTTGVLNRY